MGDLKSAKNLYEDIETHATVCTPPPSVRYVRAENRHELIQCIADCQQRATKDEVLPMLHIECHGCADGFRLADGSFATWNELKQPLTDLNIATHLNLKVSAAACSGAAIGKVMQMGERAPFWGFIGPTQTLSAEELEVAYRNFYRTLLETKSTAKALAALHAASKPGLFLETTSQYLFQRMWTRYMAVVSANINKGFPDEKTREFAKQMYVLWEPATFERYWNTFFMCDLFPEHLERFPVELVS